METRANYLLVGSFVLLLVGGLVGFVFWFSKIQFDREFARYDIVFTGSVTGLDQGSQVRYSGVRVGEVIDIRLDPADPDMVLTTIEVGTDTPVHGDTVASLELQGLTGGLYVLLSGGSAEAPLAAAEEGERPVIQSRASSLEQVLQGAPELLEGANLLMARTNLLLSDENRAAFSRILANSARLSGALADQEPAIEALFADAAATMENLRAASASVDDLARTLKTDSAGLMEQANRTLAAGEALAATLGDTAGAARADLDSLATDVHDTSASIVGLADEIQAVVAENREPVRSFTSGGLYELTTLFTEARDFVIGLNRVATEVERDPARFLFGDQQQGYDPGQ